MKSLRMVAFAGAAVLASGCDLLGSNENKTETVAKTKAAAVTTNRTCASNATYARLKESLFDEAKRIRERDTARLDALADASIVRMERPLLESRDDALDLTVCSGRLVLELPPGAGAAFDGKQRLADEVTYSAQGAADGSGTVYKVDGGEGIVYRLAGFDPRRVSGAPVQAASSDEADAAAEPVAQPAPAPDPEVFRPAPEPQVVVAPRVPVRPTPPLVTEERAQPVSRPPQRFKPEEPVRERIQRGPPARALTARPSFNCRYARSRVEKMICASETLAARDREMSAFYFRTQEETDSVTRRQLSASRLRFLASRDRCRSESCVAEAYDRRMDEIDDISGN